MIRPRKPMGAYPDSDRESDEPPTELSFEDWQEIKFIFISYGFSTEEAEWAANHNLNPKGPDDVSTGQIARLLKNRYRKVAILMRVSGFGRREVIGDCSDMRQENAERKGADDPMNLFVGESP